MYMPTGFWKDSLGDIDVIAHDEVLHIFYLSLPSHDRVGHLTSRDGLTWEEQPAALYTGDPGDFDDDQIWTMGVFALQGRFFMLYTGLAMREQGKHQRVGLATSDDLFTWTKSEENPVTCADPRWYEATVDETHRVDWRDPWVFEEDGTLHAVISARSNAGLPNRRGGAGYFASTDGHRWVVKPPLCIPGVCYDFETPAICALNNRYYLTGICGKNRDVATPNIVRVADHVQGPYRRIGHDELLPGDNLVFKPCRWHDRTLYFHNLRGRSDWDGTGNTITSLAPPKVADTTPDGALVLRPFRDWATVAQGVEQTFSGESLRAAGTDAAGDWQVAADALQNRDDSGFSAFLLDAERASLIMEAELSADGPGEFGFLFRSLPDTDDATFVSLTQGLRRVQLYTLQPHFKTPSAGITYRWRGRHLIQEWICPFEWPDPLQLRLVAYGPYCEVSVNNRVALSAITRHRHAGRVGFFAEDTSLAVHSVTVQELHEPCRL